MDKEYDRSNLFSVKDGLSDLFNRPSFHQPVIDGVRAIAVIWVLIFHLWFFQNGEFLGGYQSETYDLVFDNFAFSWLVKGGLGVDMFFVISGFLIGSILFKEIKKSDTLNFRRFYARRFLRLMPVYVVAMILGIFFLKGENLGYVWANLLYVNNFISIENQYMGWCWSLAIEEQFYLIAPIFLLMMRKSEHFFMWCTGLIFIGWGLRIFALEYHDLDVFWDINALGTDNWIGRFDHTYDNFHTRYGGLLIGVMAAWLHIFRDEELKNFFNNNSSAIYISLVALLLFIISSMLDMRYILNTPYAVQLFWFATERDIFATSMAVLIITTLYSKDMIARGLGRILSAKFLYPIAQLSYSAYLMHEMIMLWLFPISTEYMIVELEMSGNLAFALNGIISLSLTFVFAAILYVFVERPCMRLRHHPLMKKIETSSAAYTSDSAITGTGTVATSKAAAPNDGGILEAELVDDNYDSKFIASPMFGYYSGKVAIAIGLVLLLLSSTIVYTAMQSEEIQLEVEEEIAPVDDLGVFVTNSTGASIDVEPIDMTFFASSVGEDAAEPSIGITSTGCIFFIAFEKVMRSCDYGETWEEKQDPIQCAPTTSDPYGWVDPITDRVFGVQMMGLETSWICWSDDDGETWQGNPHDSGTTPLNDHIKLATGPWTDAGYGLVGQFSQSIYETAVYYCYNKIVGIFCFTSFDGGATFEAGGQIVGLATTNGGLHGAISTAPDGTVYVTPRVPTPTVIVSKDNGFSWFERTMGEDVGTPDPRKNSEISTDTDSNAYHVWTGADEGIYLARSTDSGESWEQESLRISPAEVISTAFPQTDAGDPGRFAVTYLGSENSSLLGEPDLDGNPWDGNGHYAPNDVHYHLYVTFSLNALDEEPVFHTRRLTTDPVQVGAICLNSGDCRSDQGGSNRNLLDFNDLHIDINGRVYIAIADGCTGICAEDPSNRTPANSRDKLGMMFMLDTGPSLYESKGILASVKPSSGEDTSFANLSMIDIEAIREE